MTHHTKMNFEAWCVHVQGCADEMTDGLINWRNVTFAWSERYQDGEPLATTIDALVVTALEAFEAIAVKHAVTD
jgi:hypothetical protein